MCGQCRLTRADRLAETHILQNSSAKHAGLSAKFPFQLRSQPARASVRGSFHRNSPTHNPTHNPTHRVRCLVRLTRTLAVPAVLYVVVRPNHATLIRARSVVQVHPGPPFVSSRLPGDEAHRTESVINPSIRERGSSKGESLQAAGG
jgi:hypothetical protein